MANSFNQRREFLKNPAKNNPLADLLEIKDFHCLALMFGSIHTIYSIKTGGGNTSGTGGNRWLGPSLRIYDTGGLSPGQQRKLPFGNSH